jgi:hypothetical protein
MHALAATRTNANTLKQILSTLLKLKKIIKTFTLYEQPNELMPLFAVIARRNVYI